MTRNAPAVERGLAVLEHLAAHPTEAYTLSELGAALGINVASLHAIMHSLESYGQVVRHPVHKTYRLGPAAIAIGQAAQRGVPAFQPAYRELTELQQELGCACLGSMRAGKHLIVIVSAEPHLESGRSGGYVGQRIPLVPPTGLMYFAWSTPDDVQEWFTRGSHDKEMENSHRRLMETARSLGYIVGLAAGGEGEVERLPLSEERSGLGLEPDRTYPVQFIAAPSFDSRGNVAILLNLQGFRAALTPQEIEHHGRRLRHSGLNITRAIDGIVPARVGPALSPLPRDNDRATVGSGGTKGDASVTAE